MSDCRDDLYVGNDRSRVSARIGFCTQVKGRSCSWKGKRDQCGTSCPEKLRSWLEKKPLVIPTVPGHTENRKGLWGRIAKLVTPPRMGQGPVRLSLREPMWQFLLGAILTVPR